MAADDPLAPVERWLAQALAALEPSARKALLASIGRELRKRNQRRISRQTGPDGAPWPPRKRNGHGKVRSTANMLQGLREIRRLALSAGPGGMELGYSGRTAKIAAVHHFGEVGAVGQEGPKVKYPARELLGLDADDIAFVRHAIMDALEKAI